MRREHQKLLNHYRDGHCVNFPGRDEVGRKKARRYFRLKHSQLFSIKILNSSSPRYRAKWINYANSSQVGIWLRLMSLIYLGGWGSKLQIQGQPRLSIEFKASQGYIVRSYLRNQTKPPTKEITKSPFPAFMVQRAKRVVRQEQEGSNRSLEWSRRYLENRELKELGRNKSQSGVEGNGWEQSRFTHRRENRKR